jgi:hypothetical protein
VITPRVSGRRSARLFVGRGVLVVAALIAIAALVALLLIGRQSTAAPPVPPAGPPINVVIPVYNDPGLRAVRTHLRPHLRRGDSFLIISGNQDGSIDTAWVDSTAEELRTFYPNTAILAGTSGMANIDAAVAAIEPPIEGLAYIYEPEFANEPEFTWDFPTTERLFGVFADKARGAGLRAIGKPTGRPLLAEALREYEWDYRELGRPLDDLFIQTQAYCYESQAEFEAAIDKLLVQFADTGTNGWLPQLTLDLNSRHGVPVDQALACAEAAKDRGVHRFLMWWSPAHPENAATFLEDLRP